MPVTVVEADICVPPLAAVHQPANAYPVRVGVGSVPIAAPSATDLVALIVPNDPPFAANVTV